MKKPKPYRFSYKGKKLYVHPEAMTLKHAQKLLAFALKAEQWLTKKAAKSPSNKATGGGEER